MEVANGQAQARGKRRKAKPKAEIANYYKILGTRSNATPATIKAKYVEQLRQFPPETHPDEFELIRKAYEVLRNPQRRKEYDLQRKYGGQLEEMLEQAREYEGSSAWAKAASLYQDILGINQSLIAAWLGLAHVAMHVATPLSSDEYYERAFGLASDESEQVMLRMIRARVLHEHGKHEAAAAGLEQLIAQYPAAGQQVAPLLMDIYYELDREDEMLELLDKARPSSIDGNIQDLDYYIRLVDTLMLMDRWNQIAGAQQQFRKYLKSLADAEDRHMAIDRLLYFVESHQEDGSFREALVFIELVCVLAPTHRIYKEMLKELRDLAATAKEIERLAKDPTIFPFVTMEAMETFYKGYHADEVLYAFRNSIPFDIMGQLQADTDSYAAGIVRLRKKYPGVYRRYQQRWDNLFEELTAGMNREERRSLR